MVVVKNKLVCLSFLILTSLVSVLQEICLYSYHFILFWLKLGNVSFADTNPHVLVNMLFLWEVCLILKKRFWYYCWNELYTMLFPDSHLIFLVFVVVTFHTVGFGLWHSVVRWVLTNALETWRQQLYLKCRWSPTSQYDVIMQETWNLTCFLRWIRWYSFVTFVTDQIYCIALLALFILQDLFCLFLGLKMMLYQHGRLFIIA